jgi:hypothetical protein
MSVMRYFFNIETSTDKPVNLADHQAFVRYEDYAAKCLDVETARDNVIALEAELKGLRAMNGVLAGMKIQGSSVPD